MPIVPSYFPGVTYRAYVPGDELSAAELQVYVMNQVIMTFANSTARDTALTGQEVQGMVAFLADVQYLTIYDGTAWVRYARSSDIAAADTRSTLLNLFTY